MIELISKMKRFLIFTAAISLFALLSTISCKKDDNKDSAFKCGTSTIKDVDGNVYNTVLIGEQCWMKENLKTTQYRNGMPIEYPGTNNTAWENNITGAFAWYDNDISWKDSYGALYNWHAVNNDHGLCPTGWHVPSAEWTELVDYAVAQGFPNQWYNPNGAGNALKSCRQVGSPLGGECNTSTHPRWNSWDTFNGFNEFGFSALPGGWLYPNGGFHFLGGIGGWWTSSEYSSTQASSLYINLSSGCVTGDINNKGSGRSVRCVRD